MGGGSKTLTLEEFKDRDEKNVVLVCGYDKEKAAADLKRIGLSYQKDFWYAEDLFCMLDYPLSKIAGGRKIVCWGPGPIFYNEICKNYPELRKKLGFFIDDHYFRRMASNIMRYHKISFCHNTKRLKKLKRKKYFVVINNNIYPEGRELLTSLGFQENEDFCSSKLCSVKPSELLKQTLSQKEIYPDVICRQPFRALNLFRDGSVRSCCPEWHSISYGNLFLDRLEDTWRSKIADIYRLSMLNHTYSFCTKRLCPKLMHQKPIKGEKLDAPIDLAMPADLLISVDSSCNLKCPQCRKCHMITSDEQEKRKQELLLKSIEESKWMNQIENLTIGGDGETFFSSLYKRLLFGVEHDIKRNSIRIMTNGTLFSEEYWEKLKRRYKRISFYVSLDAMSPEAYKMVRGGDWDRLMRNMDLLSRLRKNNEIEQVIIKMVVQRYNYKDMVKFVQYGMDKGFDEVHFSKIWEGGIYNHETIKEVSMVNDDGEPNEELQEVLRDPIFREPIVKILFLE